MRAKVASRWASNDGGSAETMKVSVPPVRGCWADSGADSSQTSKPVRSTAARRTSGRPPGACDPCIDCPSLGDGRPERVFTTVRHPERALLFAPAAQATPGVLTIVNFRKPINSQSTNPQFTIFLLAFRCHRLHRLFETGHRRPHQPRPDLPDAGLAVGDAGVDARGDPGPHDLADVDAGGGAAEIQLRDAEGGVFRHRDLIHFQGGL